MWSWICGENQWREELSGRKTSTIFELTHEKSSISLVLESEELTIVRKCDVSHFQVNRIWSVNISLSKLSFS